MSGNLSNFLDFPFGQISSKYTIPSNFRVNQRIIVDGTNPWGGTYKNEPGVIKMIGNDRVILVQFDDRSKGVYNQVYGTGTAEISDKIIITSYATPSSNKYTNGCYIGVKPFPSIYKELVMNRVISIGNHPRLLPGLSPNFSDELGFELPLTPEWRNKLRDTDIQYHSSRQLRFVEGGGVVIGLRCKDNISYWTHEELHKLQMIINKESKEFPSKQSKLYNPPSSYNLPVVIKQREVENDDEMEDTINFFLDKIIDTIKLNEDFKKLNRYIKRLEGKEGPKIIKTILKLYVKKNKVQWNTLQNNVYDVKEFIRDSLLKKK